MPPKNNLFRPRLPDFLKQSVPSGLAFANVTKVIRDFKLNTVCEEAKCPNRTHCYGRGTLTFQILGDTCTRSCGFCAEKFGKPAGLIDEGEPSRIVEAARRLNLQHVVITSPARDDMDDDGAGQFVAVVNHFRKELPHVTVEILTPDFRGREDCLQQVFESKPDIFNHNIETVRRLSPKVRSKATYERTLNVLALAARAGLRVKSGLMVGHGETREELLETFHDLVEAGCRMLTVGQYLPPSAHHLPLNRYYTPQEFDVLKEDALRAGFLDVAAGPLVRSSYHAEETAARTQVKSFPLPVSVPYHNEHNAGTVPSLIKSLSGTGRGQGEGPSSQRSVPNRRTLSPTLPLTQGEGARIRGEN
jgi:lipoic acid synthetase